MQAFKKNWLLAPKITKSRISYESIPKNRLSPNRRKYSSAQGIAPRALRQYIFQEERGIPNNV